MFGPRSLQILTAAYASAAILAGAALAFNVDPAVTVLELPADQSGKTLTVRNPKETPLAVNFEIVERAIAEDGTEQLTPADSKFIIFPPQAIIPPGAAQTIRVRWAEAVPAKSLSFTLFAAEQPIKLPEGESGVQTVLKVGASIHVAGAGEAAKPVLAAAEPADGGVRVTIANEGSRFIYINDVKLDFPDGKSISGDQLAVFAGRTLITPGAKRSFVVPGVSGKPELTVAADE